ncbi:efflux transporter, RND family, MFP subunit [Methylocella silvestris BL2]|uniref:Efflux transporter, RND family, MFP subunit n=1 Tax=Methylocella silvestris (strain DSM 15510 / CIP 108128 / LMG 27833 / NCIMB 13906 / BL2) TaxID=395965 RepID=B8EKK4_METSB|nr:efflux RND transporter periplasmic adaptor subunit [Methylocella silvestris]ACK51374.1 efflux transporter, RND family, MFP subunit [Methylocella silvestris BL2]
MNSMPPDPALHQTGLRANEEGEDKRKEPPRETERRERGRRIIARLIGFLAVAIVAGLVGFGLWTKSSRNAEADAAMEARVNATPTVRTAIVKEDSTPRTIELTGNMTAFDSATLFARATGYISVRHADIGTKLKKGDVLAVIAAPDLDQQLVQAKAQLVQFQAAVQQAQANADLGRVTDQRTSRLVAQGWSSAQQGDNDRLTLAARTAAVAVAKANVTAQEAAVSRLQQLTEFERITAPFDGVVTSRLVDVGSLVTADAASGTPLFSMARTDVLRVQAFVPQSATFGIKDGDAATITVSELPGKTFTGHVARNAEALSAGTRTLLMEVDVDNKDGVLSAGLYSIVHLAVRRPNPVIVIPSQAVIFNKDGLRVAVVSDGKIELRKIELEQDNGANVEVRSGLKNGDRIILSPPANVSDGMSVKTA